VADEGPIKTSFYPGRRPAEKIEDGPAAESVLV